MKLKILTGLLFIGALSLSSCGKDEQKCTKCTTLGVEIEICEKDNGNAESNGIDLNIDYDTYITSLKASGSTCK